MAQIIKNLPEFRRLRIQSLGWEDPLEKEMATYSGIVVWRIPWTEEPGELSPWGHYESDMIEQLTLYETTVARHWASGNKG